MAGKTKMLASVFTGIAIIFLAVFAVSMIIHRYYFAFSDDLMRCTGKTATGKREAPTDNYVLQKLDYFTEKKISYGFLRSDDFTVPIESDPRYSVEFLSEYTTVIRRTFDEGEYQVHFEYAWRNYAPNDPKALIYDGAGVKYFVREKCGVPYYLMEQNLRKMIAELPVDQQLSAEIIRKLELEFSTNRNLLKIGF